MQHYIHCKKKVVSSAGCGAVQGAEMASGIGTISSRFKLCLFLFSMNYECFKFSIKLT